MQHKNDNKDPGSRFEFREEYWEQALALIEADEARRRKKRRWLLWWVFCGILLSTAAIGWWKMSFGADATAKQEKLEAGQQIEHRNEINQANNSNSSQTEKTSTGQKGQSPTSEKNTRQFSAQNTDNQNSNTNNTNIANNSNAEKAGNKNQKNDSRSAKTTEQPKSAQPLQPGNISAITPTNTSQNNAPLNPTLPSETGSPENTFAQGTRGSSKNLDLLIDLLFALPLPLDSVSSQQKPAIQVPATVNSPMASQIKPLRDKPLSVSVSGAAAAYALSPDRRWLGFSSQIGAAYKFNKNWSASLGVGIRYQPGNWQDSVNAVQGISFLYSFGFDALESQRESAGLLSLELPMAAIWHRRLFSLEAGVAPGRLLYALDRFKQTKESSLTAKKTIKNRLEKGDTSPFQPFYVNTSLGLEYRFTKNTSLTLKGNYRIGPLVKATLEDPAVQGGSSLELGLRLKLF